MSFRWIKQKQTYLRLQQVAAHMFDVRMRRVRADNCKQPTSMSCMACVGLSTAIRIVVFRCGCCCVVVVVGEGFAATLKHALINRQKQQNWSEIVYSACHKNISIQFTLVFEFIRLIRRVCY